MSEPTADHVKMPSKAHLDARGNYVADENNSPLAYANTAPHSLGQLKHPGGDGSNPYCAKHLRLSCETCRDAVSDIT